MLPARRNLITTLIVACALFMEQLDGSIIATALPTISRSLQTDPLHLNMAITSYMFSLAVFIPLSGWAADRWGARTIFCAAIVVFTLGSIACGLSVDLLTLVLARILQGLGGAMMVPVGRLVLLRTIDRKDLVNAMAWVTAPALIGPVLGPPLGGLIVTYASWRWIFFVNIPIGILGIILGLHYIDNIRMRTRDELDKRGFVLIALAMVGLVFGFEMIGRHLVPWTFVVGLITGGAVCFASYLWHAKHIAHPIVDLSVLKFPTYRAALTGGSVFRISIGALPFLLPLMLQYGFGMTPLMSGLLTFASAAGAMLMKITATPVLRAFGFRTVLISGSLISVVFLMGCALFSPQTPRAAIFAFLLMGGFFRSLQFTALNTIAYAEMPDDLVSRANTLYAMMQQLTLSLGVAVAAFLLNMTLYMRDETSLQMDDFWPSYIGIGLLSLASVLAFIPLSPQAGAEMSGHQMHDVENRQ